ncbi:MAG: hypothetical protein E5X60_37760, partial [Mesorhizobium sp.]
MIRNILSASVLATLFLAAPAFTEETTIGRPIEAGSLHEGNLDMVVYYVPAEGDRLEVTATFAPKTGGDPQRVVMGLADGDSVAFSMPGHRGPLYAFSRSGEEVTVSSETGTRTDASA